MLSLFSHKKDICNCNKKYFLKIIPDEAKNSKHYLKDFLGLHQYVLFENDSLFEYESPKLRLYWARVVIFTKDKIDIEKYLKDSSIYGFTKIDNSCKNLTLIGFPYSSNLDLVKKYYPTNKDFISFFLKSESEKSIKELMSKYVKIKHFEIDGNTIFLETSKKIQPNYSYFEKDEVFNDLDEKVGKVFKELDLVIKQKLNIDFEGSSSFNSFKNSLIKLYENDNNRFQEVSKKFIDINYTLFSNVLTDFLRVLNKYSRELIDDEIKKEILSQLNFIESHLSKLFNIDEIKKQEKVLMKNELLMLGNVFKKVLK